MASNLLTSGYIPLRDMDPKFQVVDYTGMVLYAGDDASCIDAILSYFKGNGVEYTYTTMSSIGVVLYFITKPTIAGTGKAMEEIVALHSLAGL